MTESLHTFGDTARRFAKNPLGIIALFIVLVYGLSCLVTILAERLTETERLPLIIFLVLFPIVVLVVFAWLVSRHAGKLYGPADYRNEDNYVAVVASLVAASATRPGSDVGTTKINIGRITRAVKSIDQSASISSALSRNRILWVDDRPDNNVYERQAFEAVGFELTLAKSTNEAFEILDRERFVAIISDMGRREGPREGYALLDRLRANGHQIPFFIYAGSRAQEHIEETIEHGGQGTTNHPEELFQMVMTAIVQGLPRWR